MFSVSQEVGTECDQAPTGILAMNRTEMSLNGEGAKPLLCTRDAGPVFRFRDSHAGVRVKVLQAAVSAAEPAAQSGGRSREAQEG